MASESNSKVLFEPFPRQQEFIDAVFSWKYSLLCYGGSIGGGKSYVGMAILLLLCRFFPNSKWVVIRESVPTLKSTSLETFKKILPTNFLKKSNETDHIYTFKNGSSIRFMAEDYVRDKDFNRFLGLEVNGFLLEQIEELQEDLLKVCFMRAGRHKIDKMPPRPLVICNMNPTLLWPKKRIYDPWSKGLLPADWFYLPAKIYDNPVLAQDQSYMHNVTAHLDDLTRARMIDGDWTAFAVENAFLYNFKREKHVIKSYEPNRHLPLLSTWDFNVEPMTAKIGQRVNQMKAGFFKEYELSPGSTEEVCDKIIADFPRYIGNIEITGDASGRGRTAITQGNLNHYRVIRDKFHASDKQLLVPGSNLAHKDSRVLCNSVLQHAEFFMTENCELSIADCFNAQVDEFGEIKKTKDQGRHHFDNTRYGIHAWYADFIKHPDRYH